MIPKIIHYCWFGKNPLSPLTLRCLASWRRFLPDYEIIEWNEGNFPLNLFLFAKEAFENKKYAFVSDVCRLYALKIMGGIYFDTDVEILKSFDTLLFHTAFSGFETDEYLSTAIIATEKNGVWISQLLDYYHNRHFRNNEGSLETTPNATIITIMMIKEGFLMNDSYQAKEGYVAFYPQSYFSPMSYRTGSLNLTPDSYCIHHFAKSWLPAHKRWKNILKMKAMNLFGHENVQKAIDIIRT